MVEGPADYVANFELNSYDITVTVNPSVGGTVTGAGTYNHFSTCTLTAIPATGYSFLRWTRNGTTVSTSPTYQFEVTGEAAYVAIFSLNRYIISATVNPSGTGTVSGTGSYYHFATCTLTANPNTGYHFVNWTLNGNEVSTSATYQFEVSGAATYTANFEINEYTVEANAYPAQSGTVEGAGTYTHGTTCTLTAIPSVGYHFSHWSQGSTSLSTDSIYSFEVTESVNIRANFLANEYSITAEASPEVGGTVSGGSTSIHYGLNCQLVATPNSKYYFVNWTKDGIEVSTDRIYSFVVTESGHYVANFQIYTYEITAEADPQEGGTIAGAGTYDIGTEATLTATAATDFVFVYWTENDEIVSEDAEYTFTVEQDRHRVAHFDSTVGIGEHAITCSVFPNPAVDHLTVEITEAGCQLEVFNSIGVMVYKMEQCTEKVEIPVSDLSADIYVIRLTKGNSVQTARFVKK